MREEGKKLRVNIEKQLGGQVTVQLTDRNGTLFFERTLKASQTIVSLSLDLSELTEGNYELSISNGLDITSRDIEITVQKPTIARRVITLL